MKEESRLRALEMWAWRRMETISWEDRVTNEKVLGSIGECWILSGAGREVDWDTVCGNEMVETPEGLVNGGAE